MYYIHSHSLIVEPNPVASLAVTDVSSTSITIEWAYPTFNGGAIFTGVTLTYNAISNNATPSDGTVDVSYPITSIVISGLQPMTDYSVSIVVNNIVGSSTSMQVSAVTTLGMYKCFICTQAFSNSMILSHLCSTGAHKKAPIKGSCLLIMLINQL